MTESVLSRREIEPLSWDRLVRESPDGWLFALWNWQEALEIDAGIGLKDCSFAITEGSRLLAVIPLHLTPAKVLQSPALGFSGPVIAAGLSDGQRSHIESIAFAAIRSIADCMSARTIEIGIPPLAKRRLNARGVNPLLIHGYLDDSSHTMVVDLESSEDALWKDVAGNTRREITHARQAGVSVSRVAWPENIDVYHTLHTITYNRTNAKPRPRSYFAAIARVFVNHEVVLLAARDQTGAVIALHNSARFGKDAYYWTGCSTTGAASLGANHLLVWEALLTARSEGYKQYDLGEIVLGPSEGKIAGLSRFKSRFGGTLHRLIRGRSFHPEGRTRTEFRRWLQQTRRLIHSFRNHHT